MLASNFLDISADISFLVPNNVGLNSALSGRIGKWVCKTGLEFSGRNNDRDRVHNNLSGYTGEPAVLSVNKFHVLDIAAVLTIKFQDRDIETNENMDYLENQLYSARQVVGGIRNAS